MKTILKLLCLIAFLANPVLGQEPQKQTGKSTESKSIKNLGKALQDANDMLGLPVIFPTSLPDGRQLYATLESTSGDEKGSWAIISFSPDENCRGAKYCTIGSLRLKPSGVREIRKDISEKTITEEIALRDNIKGYYTPGHAMGDYWPPSLQWVYKDVLYDLWWNEGDLKTLVEMVNSALSNDSPD